ncbi:hypothetical protein B1O87_004292 [Escherichia coli]|nr:hypothetical protein [Escherichia coli]
MNKIYNIVWNESSGMWVVTSELTRKGGQRHRKIKKTMLAGLIAGLILPTMPTMAQMYNDQTLEADDPTMELSAGDTANNTIINGGAQIILMAVQPQRRSSMKVTKKFQVVAVP